MVSALNVRPVDGGEMMSVALARKNDGGDDPRSMLREAIAARAAVHARAEQHQQAIQRARNMLRDAEARLTPGGRSFGSDSHEAC